MTAVGIVSCGEIKPCSEAIVFGLPYVASNASRANCSRWATQLLCLECVSVIEISRSECCHHSPLSSDCKKKRSTSAALETPEILSAWVWLVREHSFLQLAATSNPIPEDLAGSLVFGLDADQRCRIATSN